MKLKDIWYYIQGNIRYKLFYSDYRFLIRLHIFEQICTRIVSMEKQCYMTGQCIMCGCSTTALQMCNKSCDKPCYPRMLNKQEWLSIKTGDILYIDGVSWKSNGEKFWKV